MSDTAESYRWRGSQNDWQGQGAMMRPSFRPAWIVLTVLGFIFWWPVGLALLFFSIGRGKMGCWSEARFANKMERMQYKMDRMRGRMERRGFGGFPGFGFGPPTSGNRAFDEYRMETLRRLEDEQDEFKSFLDRLRHAKDKDEFDQFMSQHRGKPTGPTTVDNPPQG